MKFTKEDAIKELVARFKAKDKDLDLLRTVTEHVENTIQLVSHDEELELDSFVGTVEKMLSSSVGLMRHQVSVAVQNKDAEISELKKKITANQEPPTPNHPNNPEVNALMERLKKLEDERDQNEKSRKISEKRNSLISKIKEGGVKNEEWINDTLAKVSISEDMDVEVESKSYIDMYNKYFSNSPHDVTPRKARGGVDGKNTVLEEVKARRKANMYTPNQE